MTLEQEDMIYFQISEESNTKGNTYWDASQSRMKLLGKFKPTTGDSKKILGKKFDKCKIYYVTRKHNEWITKIELLRGDLQKLDIQIDNPEIMSHILSNLPEEYQTIVEIL